MQKVLNLTIYTCLFYLSFQMELLSQEDKIVIIKNKSDISIDDYSNTVNKKEVTDTDTKNSLLSKRTKLLSLREKQLYHRESEITGRSEELTKRQIFLNKRESFLNEREDVISKRETYLNNFAQEKSNPLKTSPVNNLVFKNNNGINNSILVPRSKAPTIVGQFAAVVDANTGDIIYQKNSDKQTAVASTQKLMTALIVVENGDLDKKVIVQRSDVNVEASRIGIARGETYTRRILLKAMLVRSGNDIARCLARDNAGTEEAFIVKMNLKAKELGMKNTIFKNPHGLTQAGQYSTAADMAILAVRCYNNPFIINCTQIKKMNFVFNTGKVRPIINTNKVLRKLPQCNGMKTGYTLASGHCLISSVSTSKANRIVVVLKSTKSWVWQDSIVLLKWALGK